MGLAVALPFQLKCIAVSTFAIALFVSPAGPAEAQESPFEGLTNEEMQRLNAALDEANCDPDQLERLRAASIAGIERLYDQRRLDDPGEVLEYSCIQGLLEYKWGGFINIPNIAEELGELAAGACNAFRRHVAEQLDNNLRAGFEIPGFNYGEGYFDGVGVGFNASTRSNQGTLPNPAAVLGDLDLNQMNGTYRTGGEGRVSPQSMRRPAGTGDRPSSSLFDKIYPSSTKKTEQNGDGEG